MPPQQTKTLAGGQKISSTPVRAFEPEDEESGSENEGSEIMEKDHDEEELDKLVLGDSAGFFERLGGNIDVDNDGDSDGEREEADLGVDIGLEGVDDADVITPPPI